MTGAAKPTTYGGQAVIEGVMIRGKRTIGLACRKPDGGIYRYRETLDSPLMRSRVARAPFVRGIFILWESLRYGMRMLMRSADVQLAADQKPSGGASSAAMGLGLVAALALFVGVPYLLTGLLRAAVPSTLALNVAEGVLRLALLLGYLVAISFLPDIRRVFAYHGAEHMTIHALEAGDPLVVDSVRKYPTAHPRCGTEFLVVVIALSIVAFSLVGRQEPVVMVGSRIALIPVIAAVGYEILKWGAKHRGNALVRAIMYPGILVQMITTRQPTNDMIEVAIVSMEQALQADGETLPAGSGTLPRDLMNLPAPGGAGDPAAAAETVVTIDPPLPGA